MIIDSLIPMSSSFEAHPFILSPLFASNEPIAFAEYCTNTRGRGCDKRKIFKLAHGIGLDCLSNMRWFQNPIMC